MIRIVQILVVSALLALSSVTVNAQSVTPSALPSSTPTSQPSSAPSISPSAVLSTLAPTVGATVGVTGVPSAAPVPFDPKPGLMKARKYGKKAVKKCCRGRMSRTKKQESTCFKMQKMTVVMRGKNKGFFINSTTKKAYIGKYNKVIKKTKTKLALAAKRMMRKSICFTKP